MKLFSILITFLLESYAKATICFSCDDLYDPDCREALPINLATVCTEKITQCYTFIQYGPSPSPQLKRGCRSDKDSPCSYDGISGCSFCTDPLCNSFKFPIVTECFKCEGTKECLKGDFSINEVERCNNLNAGNNECFTFSNRLKLNHIYRGCLFDKQSLQIKCQNNPKLCLRCSSNHCNFLDVYHPPRLACVQCTENNRTCNAKQLIETKYNYCKKQYHEGKNNYCFRYQFPDGNIKYGCLFDDLDFCKSHKCSFCRDPMCNFVNYPIQKCIQCRAKLNDNSDCAKNPKAIAGTACKLPNAYGLMGCFVYRNKKIIRGCLTSLPLKFIKSCLYNSEVKTCSRCIGQNCNQLF